MTLIHVCLIFKCVGFSWFVAIFCPSWYVFNVYVWDNFGERLSHTIFPQLTWVYSQVLAVSNWEGCSLWYLFLFSVRDLELCKSNLNWLLLLQSFRLSAQFILYDFPSSLFYWDLRSLGHWQMFLAYSGFLYQHH